MFQNGPENTPLFCRKKLTPFHFAWQHRTQWPFNDWFDVIWKTREEATSLFNHCTGDDGSDAWNHPSFFFASRCLYVKCWLRSYDVDEFLCCNLRCEFDQMVVWIEDSTVHICWINSLCALPLASSWCVAVVCKGSVSWNWSTSESSSQSSANHSKMVKGRLMMIFLERKSEKRYL